MTEKESLGINYLEESRNNLKELMFGKEKKRVVYDIKEESYTIYSKEFKDIEELCDSEEIFWNDIYLRQSYFNGLWYLQDASDGTWYALERRYDYADMAYLVREGYTMKFYLITDEEILDEIENEFD